MTLPQLQEGLLEGKWDSTDETKGPNDANWKVIENHPQLEEFAADIEPPPPRTYDDETRLDMNALIDVCLVLLVFFIITTTVAALQKRIEAPGIDPTKPDKIATLPPDKVEQTMIVVKATLENDKTVVRIESTVVPEERLATELTKIVRASKKTKLLLEHDDNVPHSIVVSIIDAAKTAGMDGISLVVP
jgi:biopolymer transport protein ExbD